VPQTAKREQYAALIARGVSYSEACRIVGINRRTGKRWRLGRSILSSSGRRLHYAPVVGVGRWEISPRYLSEDERMRIADLRRAGEGARVIGRELGRNAATISRELRRNADPDSGRYRPFAAQRLADQRRARPREGKLATDPELREFVQDRLKQRWSPEQIAQALRREFPDQPRRHMVPETIYQAIYRPGLGGLRRDELPRVLRTGRLREIVNTCG
jgi:IS30 family transposase